MLALRSLFFAVLIPGTVAVLIPYLIVSRAGAIAGPRSPLQFLSLVLMAGGAAILIWCIRDFATRGRGTLAPVDPPKELVVQGPYRYVRNPMYLGVLLLLLGETMYTGSRALLQYTPPGSSSSICLWCSTRSPLSGVSSATPTTDTTVRYAAGCRPALPPGFLMRASLRGWDLDPGGLDIGVG